MGRGRNRRRVDRAEQAALARRTARAAGRALGLAALAAALGAAGWQGFRWLTGGEAMRIREIRFTGLSSAEAAALLELSPVKRGENLLTADTAAVERALLRDPWVLRAEVRRRWPPALEVRVEERAAAALVELGGLYLVDREAQVFKRARPGDGLDLPLVTGFTRDDYVQRRADVEALLASALRLAADWAAAGLDRRLPLSEIHLDGGDGVTVYAGEEGLQIRLGGGEVAPKLERLRAVLAALGADGKRAEAILLDNRAHPSWVTVRPEGSARLAVRAQGQAEKPGPAEEASSARRRAEAKPKPTVAAGGSGGAQPLRAPPRRRGEPERALGGRSATAPLARRW